MPAVILEVPSVDRVMMVVMVMVIAPIWVPCSVPSAVVRVRISVPRVIPSSVVASVVIRTVPAAIMPGVIPAAIPPWCEAQRVPWRIMSAPVPRTAEAVRTIVIAVVVLEVISPIIWILAYGHHCSTQLLVISDYGRHVLRYGYRVLPVSEKIYL
jgi:hypothetical protein